MNDQYEVFEVGVLVAAQCTKINGKFMFTSDVEDIFSVGNTEDEARENFKHSLSLFFSNLFKERGAEDVHRYHDGELID